MKRSRGHSYFRGTTLVVLFALCGSIAALFIADATYVDAKSMRDVAGAGYVHAAFVRSLVTSVITMVISVLVAVPAGYALSRFPFRGAIVLDILIDSLIVLPVLVVGISILVLYRQGSDLAIPGRSLITAAGAYFALGGVLNSIWGALVALVGYALTGAGQLFAWLGEVFIYHDAGIVLAMFFCSVSYAVRVMKTTFDEMDPRAEQVAMTLGCSRAGAFWRVALPMGRHGVVAAAVLSWARAVGLFGPVHIVAGTVRGRTEVLPTSIFLEISNGKLESALAMSILLIVLAFVVLLALKTFSRASLFGAGGGTSQ